MTTRNNHINPYSASDIEKYLKGELPAREMHDLEQAALEDPFLADALEGLALQPDLPQDLSDLRQRLTNRLTEDNRRTATLAIRRRITIAAVFLLLIGIGFTFYYTATVPKGLPTSIAHHQTPARAAAATADSTVMSAAPTSAPASATTSATASATTSTATSTRPALTATALARTSPAHVSTASTDKAKAKTPEPPSATPATPLPAGTALAAPISGLHVEKDSIQFKLPGKSLAMKNAFFPTADRAVVYHGIVLDAKNHPLAGASVSLNGFTSFHTTTDQQGEFRFSLHPEDSTGLLTVAMAGYHQAFFALNMLNPDQQAGNVIHLQPHVNNLDEVVVVGYGAERKETRAAIPSDNEEILDTLWQQATPIVGRAAYLLYLAAGKNQLGLDSTITGVETISFEVDRKGSLSAFKIEQSLSPAHDAGVIRLINDGPAWRLLKGRKIRAAVTVVF